MFLYLGICIYHYPSSNYFPVVEQRVSDKIYVLAVM